MRIASPTVRPAVLPRVAQPLGGGAQEPVGLLGHFGYVAGRAGLSVPQAGADPLSGLLGDFGRLAKTLFGAVKGGLDRLLAPQQPGGTPWDPGLPPVKPPKPQPPKPQPVDALKTMPAEELKRLGALPDKTAFFNALRPAAKEAERIYGVPAAVIMAQAALETGWGKSIIPGFNIFGHKGTGPAGTVDKQTWEVVNGKTIHIVAKFAKYHNFSEAVVYHGKRFHNGYYNKAVQNYATYKDPDRFARDITGIYATDPAYGSKLISIMNQYGLKK